MTDAPTTLSGTSTEHGSTQVSNTICAHGPRYDFFQAVWLLEREGRGVPVGGRGPVADERIRFRPDLSLAFPAADIRRVFRSRSAGQESSTFLFEVTFLALYGASSPLPTHYAVDILRAVDRYRAARKPGEIPPEGPAADPEEGDPGEGTAPLRDFLDIFHHRLLSLFYRSWLKYRYERAYAARERNVITDYLLWLLGYSREDFDAVSDVSPIRLLRYGGIWTQQLRSATGLAGVLEDYWEDLNVSVQQGHGRWVTITEADRARLGMQGSTLGEDLTLGAEVFDLSGGVVVGLEPLNWARYLRFLPNGDAFAQFKTLVEQYSRDPLDFSVDLLIGANEIPEARLSSGEGATRLGWTSWLRTEALPKTTVRFRAA